MLKTQLINRSIRAELENNLYSIAHQTLLKMTQEAKNPVKATRRSFDILEALYEMGSARLTDISETLDLTTSTVHNHLSTLVETGFVTRDGDRYHISLQFLTYGDCARNRYKISGACRNEVQDLAAKTSESVSVAVLEGSQGYVIAHERGATELPIDLYPGKCITLHASSFGKVLLADRPDDAVGSIIDQYGLPARTSRTITDRGELLEELETVRSRGYAVEDEERLRGIRSLATAVRNEQGIAVGAIGITGPTSRLTDDRLRGSLLESVLHTKNVVELQITHS